MRTIDESRSAATATYGTRARAVTIRLAARSPADDFAGALLPARKAIARADTLTSVEALRRFLSAVWARYMAWQFRRSMRIVLAALDDRTLAHLGLARADIDAVARELARRRPRSG